MKNIILFTVVFLLSLGCGNSNNAGSKAKIIGGKAIENSEAKFFAGLQMRQTKSANWFNYCGGVFIDARTVLTVAHCVSDKLLGKSEIRVVDYKGKAFEVEAKRLHESYNGHRLAYNDIAILRLKQPSPHAHPALLPQLDQAYEALVEDQSLMVYGRGNLTTIGMVRDSALHAVDLNPVSEQDCLQRFENFEEAHPGANLARFVINDHVLCTLSKSSRADACQGDSGGPLMRRGVLEGLVSAGHECAHEGLPALNVKIRRYLTWIAEMRADLDQEDISEPLTTEVTELQLDAGERAASSDVKLFNLVQRYSLGSSVDEYHIDLGIRPLAKRDLLTWRLQCGRSYRFFKSETPVYTYTRYYASNDPWSFVAKGRSLWLRLSMSAQELQNPVQCYFNGQRFALHQPESLLVKCGAQHERDICRIPDQSSKAVIIDRVKSQYKPNCRVRYMRSNGFLVVLPGCPGVFSFKVIR